MSQFLQHSILSLFGLNKATQASKNEFMGRLIELVEKRVMVKVLDRLSPTQQEEFLRIIDIGTDEERTVFLQTHVPDLSKLIDAEVLTLKQQAHTFTQKFAHAF